ncbi:MAG TPA: (2Fe-2S)-binding protein [Acidobacteriaceae bacterium]|nr:(2Fe-2S)-binding protein [Acidobacteriaceae bacterium]
MSDSRDTTSSAPAESAHSGMTRRGFLKGAGLTAAGTALLDGVQGLTREAAAQTTHGVTELGPGPTSVRLHVNGVEHTIEIEPRATLAEALRIHLGLTGTKVVCDRGVCSGCTVLLDRMPVNSCMTLAIDAIGHQVTTIEGLSSEGRVHPLQAAFVKHDAMQCGFCTPGMVMSCAALLERNPHPTEHEVRHAVSGNLCRCGTYPKIFAATLDAAGATRNA